MMGARLIIVLLCLLTVTEGFCQQTITTGPDARTTIDFPTKPDSIKADGKLTFIAKDSICTYTLVKTIVKDSDPDFNYQSLAYSSFTEDLLKGEGVSLVKQEDFEINGLPGRYFYYKVDAKMQGPKLVKTKIFYFDGTLYAYSCTLNDTNNLATESSAKFLESFKINTNSKVNPSEAENGDLYTKFRFGHLVFCGVFAVIAFSLYFVWKKRGSSGKLQKWI